MTAKQAPASKKLRADRVSVRMKSLRVGSSLFVNKRPSSRRQVLVNAVTGQVGFKFPITRLIGSWFPDMVTECPWDGIPVVAIGLLVGLVSSLGLTRLMSSIVYGVSSNDGVTLLAVSAILTVTAILAVYIPARRAMRVDPMAALRFE
jgi:hypothetical protein